MIRSVFFCAILLSSANVAHEEPARARDPIEGKWLGLAGLPGDRTDYGLDVRCDEKGVLTALLCSPVLNFYALPIGTVEADANHYSIPAAELKLTLEHDALEGSFSALNVPVSMKRVAALPTEAPIPDLPHGPGPRSRTKLGAPIWAGVAARDGVAYCGTTGGVMNAIEVRDGSFRWTFSAGRPIHGEALAEADALYFTCDDGNLHKLDRKTGKEIWRYDLGDARTPRIMPHPNVYEYDYRSSRPLLAGGIVYVGSGDGSFHAVSDADGERLWRFACAGKVRTDALLHADHVVFGCLDGNVYALDATSGELAWKKDTHAPVTSSPAIIDTKLLIGTRGSMLYALDEHDGAVLWRALFWGSWVESTPVVLRDHLYVGSSDLRRVSCYDPKDGALVWRTDVFGCPWARPLVTEKTVYACVSGTDPYPVRHEGSLCALERASGKILWRWPMPKCPGAFHDGFAGAPAITGDALVAGGQDGTLYVFPLE